MAFGFGLGAGLKALSAARLGIQTAGHNVSNANTPGFSRQRVSMVSSMPFTFGTGLQIGTGVDVNDVSRIVDISLANRLNLQAGMVAGAELELRRLSEIEGILGEPDAGLSQDLSGLFGAIGQLRTDPADRSLRGGAVQSAATLAGTLNMLSTRFRQLEAGTSQELQALTAQLNGKSAAIAELNSQIGSIEAGGTTANDLRDRRDMLAREMAELADIRTIQRGSGSLDVLLGGHLLVSGDRAATVAVGEDSENAPALTVGNAKLNVRSGTIGGLLTRGSGQLTALASRLDKLARNIALEFNRVHTTGVPGSGPFQSLISAVGVGDTDGDGMRGDELLNSTGLPFDVQRGELWVNVSNRSTGDIERTQIKIDPSAMTLDDFASALSSIDNLSANVDPSGKLRVTAASGYGFDFSTRLDESPDSFGSFGGSAPTLGTGGFGPFDLSAGGFPQTFTVNVGGSIETVTLDATDFENSTAATAKELAAAINDDLTNATARDVGGRLVIRSDVAGSSAQMTLADGSGGPLASLGVSLGPASGQDNPVEVRLYGQYSGAANGALTFSPDGNGEIGVTDSLTVGVYDGNGTRIGTLDVGAGYGGEELEVADGISVTFSQGQISATEGHAFSTATLADSDTSDVLAALGLNALFTGDSAANLAVNANVLANPDLFAGGLSGAAGDGSNLDRLQMLRELSLTDLDGNSLEEFYGDAITTLGFDVSAADATVQAEGTLMSSLERQRDEVSGVNIDEEMVDLVRHQQSFEAAARFINTVNEMTSTLLSLGR